MRDLPGVTLYVCVCVCVLFIYVRYFLTFFALDISLTLLAV